jgi:hypothetical protein
VFDWKNDHKRNGELVGKKQDKLGRWRRAKVPDYVNDPVQAYAIDEHMKHLGRSCPSGAARPRQNVFSAS